MEIIQQCINMQNMFTFGKRLKKAEHDIIAYDLLFKSSKYINVLSNNLKKVDIYYNLRGEVVTPNSMMEVLVYKMRINRRQIDKGLYAYRYGCEVFADKINTSAKDAIVVPVIIPAGAYYSYNLFGHILSSKVIYPNKF